MQKGFLFTSESVTEGHPDKIADQISDSIVDACLENDKKSRVACETLVTTNFVLLAGEIATQAKLDYTLIARQKIKDIGYNDPQLGFSHQSCEIIERIDTQSPDIAQGINENEGLFKEQGAGDQGLMFGYATNETKEFMPMPIAIAHRLSRRLAEVRKNNIIPYLKPDGKTQVTVRYENQQPLYIDTIVISSQHEEGIEFEQIQSDLIHSVGQYCLEENFISERTKWYINPTGKFVNGGPRADVGLTGRKVIADTYGGMGRHGGGAFSGKDPTKVDRSASYACRYIAKNIVAAELASECEVQVAYAIGKAQPVSLNINCFGTCRIDETKIIQTIQELCPLTPAWIISKFNLLRPIYQQTSVYGHFGRNEEIFTWEALDIVSQLKTLL